MADTVVSPLLSVLSDRFDSLLAMVSEDRVFAMVLNDRIWEKTMWGKTCGKMRLTLAKIQAVSVNAEQLSEKNDAVKCWLKEVKIVAYGADDFFDELELLMLENKKCLLKKMSRVLVLSSKLYQLQVIQRRLDELLQEKPNFYGVDSFVSRPTHSLIDESNVVGRDQDKNNVIELLLSRGGDERQISVIPIVGMGGIGKTTLAQIVYKDELVQRHFNLSIWVSVTEVFDLMAVARKILEAASDVNQCSLTSIDILGIRVREILSENRFLIVLDDIWMDDSAKLYDLLNCIGTGRWGSTVLLTTRFLTVADIMGTVEPYILEPLSNDDSWLIFNRRAFYPSEYEGQARLKEIGRRIVNKCKGLPLAAKTLGSFLRSKRQESDWVYVMEEDMWKLTQFETGILPTLMLSYNHLQPCLKQCFAYCSIVPKDHVINKEKLIKLWIAQGFVLAEKGSRMLEDIGNEYFMELLQSSFFTGIVKDDYGDIVECRMHDLVHDLALFITGNTCWIVGTEFPGNISRELRHSSLVSVSGKSTIPQVLHHAKNLRTLILLSGEFKNLSIVFPMFICLRVLDLSQSGLRKLPVSVGNLKHLRYLDLSHTYIQTLPRSISELKRLQILELSGCYNLRELPKAISELINLRHLGIQSCSLLLHMPFGIGKLRLLQTLPTFILGNTHGCGSISELSSLNLKGRLEIKNLENVRNLAEAHAVKLYDKLSLHSLGFSWGDDFDWTTSAEVLESLSPPPALRVLDIIGYRAHTFPSWLQDRNLTLLEVSLINCGCQSLPPLGQLPYLRNLSIKGLSEVQIIGHEFYGDLIVGGFPSLQQFKLSDMPNLLEWQSPLTRSGESSNYNFEDTFPCLHTLSVKGCIRLNNLPLFPNLKKLALSNCNPMLVGSLGHLTSLSSLVFDDFRKLFSSINLGRLDFVRTLTIYDCDDLISLLEEAMQGFTSLEHLSILSCHRLYDLPKGMRYLTSLQKLEIVDCQELVDLPDVLQFLTSLKELVIEDCPNLESFPDSLQGLIDLEMVVIKRCPKLERELERRKALVL